MRNRLEGHRVSPALGPGLAQRAVLARFLPSASQFSLVAQYLCEGSSDRWSDFNRLDRMNDPLECISMKNRLLIAVVGGTLAVPSLSMAIFYDNFDTENGGVSSLNYGSFANWDVSGGTVDLIANGAYGLSGSGMFVDMDGSTSNAGVLTTKTAFALSGGTTYVLRFSISGNQRGGADDSMTVSLGSLYSEVFTRSAAAPWEVVERNIFVAAGTNANLAFDHAGGDHLGMLLDEVEIAVVPEPTSLAAICGGVIALLRRRKQ
ncbi:MAG: PEP-CTERM sorting domain-containing protein [Armatimonadetes bacterium]|nr:MAG: PEP-CTERM sorting domain-containing protein [Armatimonadota bacterium]